MTEKEKDELLLISEDEYSPEVEALVVAMYRWRRMAYCMGAFMFITGLMLTLLWVGSLDSDGQQAWLRGFGEFLVMTAVVTGPLFILIAAASTAWSERKKLVKKVQEQKLARLEAAQPPGTKPLKASINIKDRIKALIQVEMGRNIRSQLLQFSLF